MTYGGPRASTLLYDASLLDDRAAEWRQLPRGTEAEWEAADAYYEAQVLPLQRAAFAAREHARLPRHYTALIVSVGRDPVPAVLSLAALQPERLHLISTAEDEPAVAAALAMIGHPATPYEHTRLQDQESLEAYAAVRDVCAAWGAPSAVGVDITGGPAAVSAGMAMAAYAIGAGLVEVRSEEWWPDVGRPRPGSEYLAFPAQPLAAFGDLAQREARRAFNGGDYRLAQDLFGALARETGDAEYTSYRDLAAAYAAWDALDAAAALAPMADLVAAVQGAPHHPLAGHLSLLARQLAVIERLQCLAQPEEPPEDAVMANLPLVLDLVFTLQQAVGRRAAAGQYTDAVLLEYRLLELLTQRRLALRGIGTLAPDYGRLGIPDLAEAFRDLRARLLQQEDETEGGAELPHRIGVGSGLLLLQVAGDPLPEAVDWELLRECLPARSRSILAHGFRWLGEAPYAAFRRLLEPILSRFCEAEGVDREEAESVHRFVGVDA